MNCNATNGGTIVSNETSTVLSVLAATFVPAGQGPFDLLIVNAPSIGRLR